MVEQKVAKETKDSDPFPAISVAPCAVTVGSHRRARLFKLGWPTNGIVMRSRRNRYSMGTSSPARPGFDIGAILNLFDILADFPPRSQIVLGWVFAVVGGFLFILFLSKCGLIGGLLLVFVYMGVHYIRTGNAALSRARKAMEDYEIIVQSRPRDEADAEFQAWLAAHPQFDDTASAGDLVTDDVMKETDADELCHYRGYRIKKTVLEGLRRESQAEGS